jgi:hypothetical protein
MRNALAERAGQPIEVRDDTTDRVYLLIGEDAFPALWDQYLRREVEKGLAAIDRGETEDWDVESVKAEAREILKKRETSPS